MSTTISIALATYNGAQYLPEQLESYLEQDLLPDELVVCDDGSRDESLEILRAFAKRAPFPVHVEQNSEQLGIAKNFEKAVSLCEGSVIAFSDQDDVWLPQKLSRIAEAFAQSPSIGAVVSNALVVDEHLKEEGITIWEVARFNRKQRRLIANGDAFEVLIRNNYIYGCSLAFRASYKDCLIPFPEYGFIHDQWTIRLIAAFADIGLISDPLLKYRRHSHNNYAGEMRSTLTSRVRSVMIEPPAISIERKYLKRAGNFQQLYDRLASIPHSPSETIDLLEQHIQFYKRRSTLPRQRLRRLPQCIQELVRFNYHRHEAGFASFARDMLLREP